MENIESSTKKERDLRKFVYKDYSDGGKIIFECIARGILEADKLYEEKTGNNPEKQNNIGCSTEKVETNEEN